MADKQQVTVTGLIKMVDFQMVKAAVEVKNYQINP